MHPRRRVLSGQGPLKFLKPLALEVWPLDSE